MVPSSGFLPAESGVSRRERPHESRRIPMVHCCAEQEEQPVTTPASPDPAVPGRSNLHDADLDGLSIARPSAQTPRRPSHAWRWTWGAVIVVLVVLAWAWATGLLRPAVTVDVVGVVRLPPGGSRLAATGYVVAQRQASIASKGIGRLEFLGVKVGDWVKAGQVIARLEHADVEALLQQAQAHLGVARAQLNAAKPELDEAALHLERMNMLLAKSFVTQAEHDMASARIRRATAAVHSAEAAVAAAEAERRNVTVQLENTNVRAPFDGVVVKKLAEVGEVVAPINATVRSGGSVVSIVDPTSVVVDAEVSESMIHRVQRGQPADIQLDAVPDYRYHGEVMQVMPVADRAKATILVRIRLLDLDERVRPDVSAKVTFGASPGTQVTGEEWSVPS
ncbi:MAG: efflux RND transporter periplasmic adaptor subunit, partial [Verrucomicrobia bacterium]|nr:efflux RND transporter periplasmic adaptor subunit [Verrucomicrobiota bacterium]